MECRPVSDMGLVNGGISDDAISVSGSEPTYSKEVSAQLILRQGELFVTGALKLVTNFR